MSGELDISGVDALRAALDQLLLEPEVVLEIEVADLSFIDSAAISELLHYHLVTAAAQRQLCLVHASRTVASVLDVLDLGDILIMPKLPASS